MDNKSKIIKKLQSQIGEMDSKIKSLGNDSIPGKKEGVSSGMSLDFSDPLQEVYEILLKEGEMTMEDMLFHPKLGEIEDLAIRIKILVRHGTVKRNREGKIVKFKAV